MKKPPISPGSWKTNGDPYVSTQDGRKSIGFLDVRGMSNAEAKANTVAVAAVPDLIDALIDADKTYEIEGWPKDSPTRQVVRAALIKAGCTEDE